MCGHDWICVGVPRERLTLQGTLGPLVPSPSSSGASRLPCVRLSDALPVGTRISRVTHSEVVLVLAADVNHM